MDPGVQITVRQQAADSGPSSMPGKRAAAGPALTDTVRGAVSTPYGEAVLAEAPRVLSLLDRDPASRTAGCGDRTYWAWKFVDFPASRMQEAVCTLAFLYRTPLAGSPYYQNRSLLGWIELAFGFWSRLQHRDGSFDEAYPFERSLAATAFTSFYVGEALRLLGEDLPAPAREAATVTLARAGEWLRRNDETHGFLSNHLAAAAGALVHIAHHTGDERFRQRSDYFLHRILGRQSPEGWYDEYGGADPGYQTHGSFYLARCWQLTGETRLAESLARACGFLAHFVHPDGSLGGLYASRNTQTYYPAAFEMLAGVDPAAAWIARTLRSHVDTGAAASLRTVDVFNYYPFLNNFVFAHQALSASTTAPEAADPTPDQGLTWFPAAGLARMRTAEYEAYVGAAKGGVLVVFDRRTGLLRETDCGYFGTLRAGGTVSTQYQDPNRTVRVEPTSIEIEGRLVRFARPAMRPGLFLVFRVFTLTIGRAPSLARWLKRRLVRTLIYRTRPVAIQFARRIEFGGDGVLVRDRLAGPDAAGLSALSRGARFSTIHMGSSRYFILQELQPAPADQPVDPPAIVRGVELKRTIGR